MPARTRGPLIDSQHVLMLKGLLLLAVVGFAFFGAWRHGLLPRVWTSDRTGISVAITLVFLAAFAHGSICLVRLSRAFSHLADVQRHVAGDGAVSPRALAEGCVGRYVQDLQAKTRLSGARAIDRGLLLETFGAELRHGHLFGGFVSDLLLSLGLLGTVIGLIVMLGPMSGPDAGDPSALKGALAATSGGMAVALYAALTGLTGGTLLKLQGFLLDGGVDELVRRTARLTEAHMLPTTARMQHDANV